MSRATRQQRQARADAQGGVPIEVKVEGGAVHEEPESCGSCRFRLADGTCRARPPQPKLPYATLSVWPSVPETGWCGEYEGRAK